MTDKEKIFKIESYLWGKDTESTKDNLKVHLFVNEIILGILRDKDE